MEGLMEGIDCEINCIEAVRAATINKPPFEAICVSNIIKHLWNYEKQNGLEDLHIAAWYINRLIQEVDSKNKLYKLVATENGVGIQTPWHTLIVPHEGDMFDSRGSVRDSLLSALLDNEGFCLCKDERERDNMCPCSDYRNNGKCMCGLFVKVPQVVEDNNEKEGERVDRPPTDGAS